VVNTTLVYDYFSLCAAMSELFRARVPFRVYLQGEMPLTRELDQAVQ